MLEIEYCTPGARLTLVGKLFTKLIKWKLRQQIKWLNTAASSYNSW